MGTLELYGIFAPGREPSAWYTEGLVRTSAFASTLVLAAVMTSTACTERASAGRASAYPEAALVDVLRGGQLGAYCSGALIAPSVVLTAGHCVKGQQDFVPDAWTITLPYAGHQRIAAVGAATYDWESTNGTVDPGKHDIGLVFLARPVHLPAGQCPRLATEPLRDQAEVVHVGRLDAGRLSTTSLFVAEPVPVTDGAAAGFPFDYDARAVIARGDSGGPVEQPGANPHLIVAVGSGSYPGKNEVLARVDLLNSASNRWIADQVRAHGGGCGI
ncbi:MAG TPA: trypsin-like serine protease [Polyangiaceae bacterium]|jgi:secreted trypsin-like serine protease